jgi:hypothetical protein
MNGCVYEQTGRRCVVVKPSTDILIFTRCGDLHAVAVHAALESKGQSSFLWYSSDYPQHQQQTISLSQNEFALNVTGDRRETLIDGRLKTFWFRRAYPPLPDYEKLHPDDHAYVRKASSDYHAALRALIDHPVGGLQAPLWVNRPHYAMSAESKPLQLKLAAELGWRIPATIITNDPAEIRAFVERLGGRAVHKSLGSYWWQEQEAIAIARASLVSADGLPSDSVLSQTAEIYQEPITKQYEVRAFFFGRSYMAIRIDPGERGTKHVDWRVFHQPRRADVQHYTLPAEIEQLCFKLLEALNIVSGSFDLFIDDKGEFVFSEINQSGQFIWLEDFDLPVLDAFTEFLISGDPHFEWRPNALPLRAHAVYESAPLKALLAEESFRYRTHDGVVGGVNGAAVPEVGGHYG